MISELSRAAGFDHHLVKPIGVSTLISALSGTVSGAQQPFDLTEIRG